MKIKKLTYGLLAAAALSLASCDINDMPEFNDADAYVAFLSSSVVAEEGGDPVKVSVLLTSLSGISATVEVEVIDSTAVEGKDFTIENKTLTFTKENPQQEIVINITNDDEYTGSRAFTLALKESGVKQGAAKKCVVSIADDEHPLLFLFNTYTTSVSDFWGDAYNIEGTITRDKDDDKKVWLNDFFTPYLTQSYGFHISFYGIVNDDKTEIRVPAGQETGVTSSGVAILLNVGADADVAGDMSDSGQDLVIQIKDGGSTLVFVNAWGAAAGTNFYDRIGGGLTWTKK